MAQIVMVPRWIPNQEIEIPTLEILQMASPASPYAHTHSAGIKKVSPTTIMNDSWYDFKQWYQMANHYDDFTLHQSEIENKTWSFSQVTDAIDALYGTVLVQPVGHNGWKIGFKERESTNRFRDWWNALVKNYTFNVVLPIDQVGPFNQWMKEHVKGQARVIEGPYVNGERRYRVEIREHHEAIECKMRWYNLPEPEPA